MEALATFTPHASPLTLHLKPSTFHLEPLTFSLPPIFQETIQASKALLNGQESSKSMALVN
jgi:hypothetical protein